MRLLILVIIGSLIAGVNFQVGRYFAQAETGKELRKIQQEQARLWIECK